MSYDPLEALREICRYCGDAPGDPQEPNECPEGPNGVCLAILGPNDLEWVICDRCRGDGILGGYPGVYTADMFAEDPDLREDYYNHRRACEDCGGTGKLRELTEEARNRPEVDEALREHYETEAIYEMERRMGA